jgi:hypothetical protein
MKAVLEKAGLRCLVIPVKQTLELLPLQLQCTAATAGRRRSQRSQRLKRRLLLRMMGSNRLSIMATVTADEVEDVVVISVDVDVVMDSVVDVAEVTEAMEANAVVVVVEDVEMAFVAEIEEVVEAHRGLLRQAE